MKEFVKEHVGIIIKIGIVVVILIVFAVIGFIVRSNIPLFVVNNIYVKSTAIGTNIENSVDKSWNLVVDQTNDIYIDIGHIVNPYVLNEDKKYIKSLSIENVEVVENPILGTDIKKYYISDEEQYFQYKEEFEFVDKLVYNIVPTNANIFNQEINNQGGQIAISIVNKNVIEHKYDNVTEITHDGSLLKNAGVSKDDIIFKVSFNIILITVNDEKYIAKVEMNLPYGDIIEEGMYIGEYPNESIFEKI